jgi:ABC-type glycerol-3-phosphate transport system substrate-binding protein
MLKDLSGYTRTARYPFDRHFAGAFPPHLEAPNGRLYGLPVSILTVVRYVNKSLLAQIGLTAPRDWSRGDWTVAQMLENSRRLTRGNGPDKVFGMRMQLNAMHFSQ